MARIKARGRPQIDEQSNRPVYPLTGRGLRDAAALAGFELRWNTRGRCLEGRHKADRDWQQFSHVFVDELLYAVSEVASMAGGAPWRAGGARMERRLLTVAARLRCEAGEASGVYEAVFEWASGVTGGRRRCTLTGVMQGAKVINKYEVAARVPHTVRDDAKDALRDAGWEWKPARPKPGANPLMRWVPPGADKPVNLKSWKAERSRAGGRR